MPFCRGSTPFDNPHLVRRKRGSTFSSQSEHTPDRGVTYPDLMERNLQQMRRDCLFATPSRNLKMREGQLAKSKNRRTGSEAPHGDGPAND